MTHVTADSRATSIDSIELSALQFYQPPISEFQTNSATPSVFELLFSQQLASSTSADANSPDDRSDSFDSGDLTRISNISDTNGSRSKSASNDSGSEVTPFVNPLMIALMTAPASQVADSNSSSIGRPPKGDASLGATGTQNSEPSNLSGTNDESNSVDAVVPDGSTSKTEDVPVEEEFSTETYAFNNVVCNQPAYLPFPNSAEPMTDSPSSTSMSEQVKSVSRLETSNQESLVSESSVKAASVAGVLSVNRGSKLSEVESERGIERVNSSNSIVSSVHSYRRSDESIRLNLLVLPPTAYISAGNVSTEESVSDQLAKTIVQHLDEEQGEGPTSVHIRLDQPGLGSVSLHLTIINNVVSIRITTQSPLAKQVIENQMNDLRQSLINGGVTCGQCQVACDSNGQQFSQTDDTLPEAVAPSLPVSSRWARTQPTTIVPSQADGRLNVVA